MELPKLAMILKATVDPNARRSAEEQLDQIHKIIGFAPALLQVVMSDKFEMPVRQAGAVYLKNMVCESWCEREGEGGEPAPFHIHEQDRGMLRESIIEAVIHAPELLRSQLVVCVASIIKNDFPTRWTEVVDKISIYLQNPEPDKVYGALLCLHRLVKNYEKYMHPLSDFRYKKLEKKAPLFEAMHLLLPQIKDLMARLVSDNSELSVSVQKLILKIYFTLVQFNLPLDLLTREVFAQWMELLRHVLETPVPEECNSVDEDERPELIWWKCKKWAMHILVRLFERYGCPGYVNPEYESFADWYITTFSAGIIQMLLKLLEKKQRNEYIPPRIMQYIFEYLKQGLSHSLSWKLLKEHMVLIITQIVFPVLCHTPEDEELWETDPAEYIRIKFNSFDDEARCNSYAALSFLKSACAKRKQILPQTIQFILSVVQTPNVDPRQKDGALAMMGSVADLLTKKPVYKNETGNVMKMYVFPEFNSPHGFLRARACWVLSQWAETVIQDDTLRVECCKMAVNMLLMDKETRVKLEAASALNSMLIYQEDITDHVRPQVRDIVLQILEVVKETKNDEITNVLQKLICLFPNEMACISEQISTHLTATFLNIMAQVEKGEEDEEYSITTMSIINTIETFISVMEDHKDILAITRPIVLQVVVHILSANITEFYEEAFSLMYELTNTEITPDLWNVLELIFSVFHKSGCEYFVDMMPLLHNYVTVSTDAFLSKERHMIIIFDMCKTILDREMGEDPESHAAKLLEVIILQCKGRIDQCIPVFVEVVLRRLLKGIKTSELRIMCLQVVIAALYYNPQLLLDTLNKLQQRISPNESLISHFIGQWIHDADCFLGLHDRKICILGLCTLMMLPEKPIALTEFAPRLMPSLILLFKGLKRAYAARAQEQSDSESSGDSEEESSGEETLSSDEDDYSSNSGYLNKLHRRIKNAAEEAPAPITQIIETMISDGSDESDLYDEDSEAEETPLESFGTPLDEEENVPVDEYIVFKDVMLALQERDPNFYNALTAPLNTEQQKDIQEIIMLADQRRAAAESKKIEESGGYVFVQQAVPTSFNFGGSPLGH